MQVTEIAGFELISDIVRQNSACKFYRMPLGEEALVPVDIGCLLDIMLAEEKPYNPYYECQNEVLPLLFNFKTFPDKNYDDFEIIKGKHFWVLYRRLYNYEASIVSVIESSHEMRRKYEKISPR